MRAVARAPVSRTPQLTSCCVVLKNFERFHDLVLIVTSLTMAVGTIFGAIEVRAELPAGGQHVMLTWTGTQRAREDGAFSLVCATRPANTLWDGQLGFWTYRAWACGMKSAGAINGRPLFPQCSF